MLRSIRTRLILSSALPSLVFLVVGLLVVLVLARGVQRQEFLDTLEVELLQLASWASVNEEGVFESKLPGSTRFEIAFSGWYYQVFHVQNDGTLTVVASSSSLQQSRLNITLEEGDIPRWQLETIGPTGESLMALVQRVSASTLADGEEIPNPEDEFLITVARDQEPIAKADANLFRALGLGAGAAFVLMSIGTVILVGFTLGPLRQVETALHRIRSGQDKRLEGEFLKEIEPLASEINLLIDENEKVIERARTQVGNLAHALKTPLSVLTNEAGTEQNTLAAATREQVSFMRSQVDRYLARARVAASSQVIGVRTELAPILDRLARVMEKINLDKNIDLTTDIPTDLFLRGEQQDLEEIVGNLLENAYKWADSKVLLNASRTGDDLEIIVEDDGPGLKPEDRVRALKRGQRLDETTPGTGLGLSIVADVVSAYGGAIHLEEASIGGLKVIVTLPSAQ